MASFILFIVLTLPGQPAVPHSQPADTLEECLAEAAAFLAQAQTLARPGMVQAGCVIIVPGADEAHQRTDIR